MARTRRPDPRARLLFFLTIAMWAALPLLLQGNLAQDALPFLAAGDLAHSHPGAIYATQPRDLYDLPPEFAARSCELSPPGTKCSDLNVAFVSPPQAFPASWLVGRLGPTFGVLLMRFVAALSLAGGMWLLWNRLATRTREASLLMAGSAVLLTPMAILPITLGQNSPLLFLSACLGVGGTRTGRGRALAVALVWVATVSFKAFPAALLLVLLWQRRWQVIGWAIGAGAVLTALVVPLGPASWYGDFLDASRALGRYSLANPYNGALDSALHHAIPSVVDASWWDPVSLGVRLLVVGGLWWCAVRRAGDDVQWAWAWTALLWFVPLVWWHYLWVGVAAVAVSLADRRRSPGKLLRLLPVLALVTVPISIPNSRNSAVPWAQALFLVACVVGTALLADRSARAVNGEGGRAAPPGPSVPAPAGT